MNIRNITSKLRDALGDRFVRGAVLHTGTELTPLGDRIFAAPLGMVFSGSGRT